MPLPPLYFNIVFEDVLSEAVIERLLALSPAQSSILRRFHGRGSGYIRTKIQSFFEASLHHPFFVLMDSDKDDCALHLLDNLVPKGKRNNKCLFRIAVREIESWLLADHHGIARFFGINAGLVGRDPEKLPDPKAHLIQLAQKSRKKDISRAIVPDVRTSAVIGPEYNQALLPFIQRHWDIHAAAKRSESLRRAIMAVKAYKT